MSATGYLRIERYEPMKITDQQTDIASDVRDLRDVPLSLVHEAEIDRVMRRIVPDSPDIQRVSVAAFNSSI
ncbi:hypothetical protein IMZ11_01535 [Microtetraspora sp. AC03309]|uniref:hypothetical protein n=1 Tax=Microtetraspora sp. AC03309 TaxID=2779376 RepID=UPI001E34C985|nr:hypothetical protein [Microtetraspora sp. AC03309]MCC5574323.1 hypothetical protein [Microtetraspora sp. AC03309]